MLFLEHIPFFSIPNSSYNMTKSNLIHIDHFNIDAEKEPITILHVPTPLLDMILTRLPLIA